MTTVEYTELFIAKQKEYNPDEKLVPVIPKSKPMPDYRYIEAYRFGTVRRSHKDSKS